MIPVCEPMLGGNELEYVKEAVASTWISSGGKYIKEFEQKFVSQRQDEDRSIEQTLDMGWEVLRTLPVEELHRITDEEIEKFYGK